MPTGPMIRQMLGPLERPISDLYRSVFVDLNAFVSQIETWVPASNILELGCGEGAVIERLVKSYPQSSITGIDITPRVGRMFRGDSTRVVFKQQTINEFAVGNPASFDLVIVGDVMHHIPWELHKEILVDAAKVLKPGSYMVLKDWERSSTPIHWLCYFSDRYITGDHVRYKTAAEFQSLIKDIFGTDCIKKTARIRPWPNNIAFLIQTQ